MFKNIYYKLLLSYLLVLASVLSIFAFGVRWVFSYSLKQQIIDKLTALGEGIIAGAEGENNQLKLDYDFKIDKLLNQDQSLQWFDTQGNLLFQQGKILEKSQQLQEINPEIQTVTLPIIDSDNNKLVGYLRISQSLEEHHKILEKLDLGLGIGIILALVVSGGGGIILTNQVMGPIEDTFKRLKQFTADASHEFRNPLMVIESNVTVSLKYSQGMRETDRESFEAIASATSQMTNLTEGLLLLARAEKNNIPQKEKTNLKIIIEDLIKFYQPQFVTKNISIRTELNEFLLISGDAIQLSRLFSNLIENALHYTPQNGLIQIKGEQKNLFIEIKVKDTGIGIASEHLDKIFERFWRADTSRSYWDSGSGLGLSIVQAIAQNHGGTITVTSELTKGSCFTVRLPTNSSFDHQQYKP